MLDAINYLYPSKESPMRVRTRVLIGACMLSCLQMLSGCKTQNHLLAFSDGESYGYMDTSGNVVIAPDFSFVSREFSGDYAVVGQGSKYGLINRYGQLQSGFSYLELIPLSNDGSLWAGQTSEAGGFALLDASCSRLTPHKYSFMLSMSENVIVAKEGPSIVFLNKHGQKQGALEADYAWPFSNGHAVIKRGSRFGIVNNSFEEVVPPTFLKSSGRFSPRGLLPVADRSNKWGLVDVNGEWVKKPSYLHIYPFLHPDVAVAISTGGDYWLINSQGQKICTLDGLRAEWFYGDRTLAYSRSSSTPYIINTKGEIVSSPENVQFLTNFDKRGYAEVQLQSGATAVMHDSGVIISPKIDLKKSDNSKSK